MGHYYPRPSDSQLGQPAQANKAWGAGGVDGPNKNVGSRLRQGVKAGSLGLTQADGQGCGPERQVLRCPDPERVQVPVVK